MLGPSPVEPTLVAPIPRPSLDFLRAQSTTSTFIVNYDAGFDANPSAKAAFQFAVDQWSNLITSSVPIVVDAEFSALPPGVLGSAGPETVYRDFSGAPEAATWYPVALGNALHGSDLDPGGADISASFSSSFGSFYFGTDGNTNGDIDFVSVVMHELGHGLGFLGITRANPDGTGSCCLSGYPTIYDRFTTSNGTPLLSFADGSLALGNALKGATVRFTGPWATAANGGTAPRLYAPASWSGGSSYSHLDESTFPAGNANSLMTPSIGGNEVIHSPGLVTLGLFADTGWVVSGPPTISIGGASIVEGNSTNPSMRINVSLSQPVPYAVTAIYRTAPDSATTPADFTAKTGSATIPAGATATTASIIVRGDTLVESTERFQVRLTSAAGAVIGRNFAWANILNDDASTGIAAAVGNAAIEEGVSGVRKIRITVNLSAKSTTAITVDWTTGTGSASPGVDYVSSSGTLTIPANSTGSSVAINVNPDSMVEGNETFAVTISNPSGASIRRANGTATILNDD